MIDRWIISKYLTDNDKLHATLQKKKRSFPLRISSFKCRLSQSRRQHKSIYDDSVIHLSQISFGFN